MRRSFLLSTMWRPEGLSCGWASSSKGSRIFYTGTCRKRWCPFISWRFFGISYLNSAGLKESWYFKICANIWAITSVLLVIQAFAVIYWFVTGERFFSRIWLYAAGFAAMFMPMISLIFTYVGAYDLLFNFRKLPKKPPQDEKNQRGFK
jgi:hypothetical protein